MIKRLLLPLPLAALFLGAGLLFAQAPVPTPDPPKLAFVLEEIVTGGMAVQVGDTPRGKRDFIPILAGTVTGPGIKGMFLPGGWDWRLTSPNGCRTLHADYMIKTDDGVIINVVDIGTRCPDSSGKTLNWVTSPTFEAPNGSYGWLNNGVYVSTMEAIKVDGKSAERLRVYRVQPLP